MYSIAKHILAFFILWLFLSITSPGVFWGDGGLLISSAWTLGIPHPTGHPLFAMLGKFAAMIPLGNIAFRLNIMAIIACFLIYYIVVRITVDLIRMIDKSGESSTFPGKVIPMVIGVVFTLSPVMISQAASVETYSLNLILSLLVIMLVIRAEASFSENDAHKALNYILIASFLLGLAAGNHSLLIMCLFVPFIFYIFYRLFKSGNAKYVYGVLFFMVIGLSVYLYLPVRAHSGPSVNMGDPQNIDNLLWVITGEQFRENTFSAGSFINNFSLENLVFTTKATFDVLAENIYYFWIGFVLFGLVFLLKRQKVLFAFLLFTVLIQIAVTYPPTFNTKIPLAERGVVGYYLLSVALLLIIGAIGLYLLFGLLNRTYQGRFKYLEYAFYLFFVGWALFSFYLNEKGVDKSRDYSAQLYGHSLLGSMEYGSLFLTITDAGLYIPTYQQRCEGYREDIDLINRSMLFSMKGMELLKGKIKAYPSEYPDPGNNYIDWVKKEGASRGVYLETGSKYRLMDDLIVPHSMVFSLKNKNNISESEHFALAQKIMKMAEYEEKFTDNESVHNTALAMYNIGNYFLRQGKWESAIKQYKIALEIQSEFKEADNNLLYCYVAADMLHEASALGALLFGRIKTPLVYFSYALNLVYSGEPQRAKEVVAEGMKLFPDDILLKGYLRKLEGK